MSEPKDFVICRICNKKYKKITNTHLGKHNLTFDEYEKTFQNAPISSETHKDMFRGRPRSKEIREKISKTNKKLFDKGEREPWSKGLSADPNNPNFDPRLHSLGKKVSETLKEMYASGERASWNKGLTKETDERVARYANKQSITMLSLYATGERVPWQRGQTKETDERIQLIMDKRALWWASLPKAEKWTHCNKLKIGVSKSWEMYTPEQRRLRIKKNFSHVHPSPSEIILGEMIAELGYMYNTKELCSGYSVIIKRVRSIIPDYTSETYPNHIIQFDGWLGHNPDSPYVDEGIFSWDDERDRICLENGFVTIRIVEGDIAKGKSHIIKKVMKEGNRNVNL